MSSLPPAAGAAQGSPEQEGEARGSVPFAAEASGEGPPLAVELPPDRPPPASLTVPHREPPASTQGGRALPPIRPSDVPVELTLDLRATPPDKILPRIFGALERVSADVTLLVLLRDTPEYAGVMASAYQALRARGYVSDSARMPQGGQRLRIRRRAGAPRPALEAEVGAPEEPEPPCAPPPRPGLGTILPGERFSGRRAGRSTPDASGGPLHTIQGAY